MNRPTMTEAMMGVAFALANRSTCARRSVGCVLLDEHMRIIGTGYNGVARGLSHCIDSPCSGADFAPGEGLDKCEAIHAEANALLHCADTLQIHTCVVTHSPCIHCVKLLMNTSCKRIIYSIEYAHDTARELAREAGIDWVEL